MKQTAGVILNGGQSSRMGSDKSQLMLHGKTLLELTHHVFIKSGISAVYVSGDNKYGHEFNFINDLNPNCGPLVGIQSCLNHLEEFDRIVFLPVDMPMINSAVIKHLINNISSAATNYQSNPFPLLIQNSNSIRTSIHKFINNNQLAIHHFLETIEAHSIISPFSYEVFLNANTPKQWKQVLSLAKLIPI